MEALRDQRGLPWLDDLAHDLRYGLRALRRNRAYTAIIVLVLALGIGANVLIFSMINVVLLLRFPYRLRSACVQPANNFLAIHRASLARCGPSTSDPAMAPSNSTTRARAVAFGSFTPAAFVHSRKRSANHSR
jgi:hypothetical protein